MRIHVFLVDTGTMYHVDINMKCAVSSLKEEVRRITKVPVDKQVMLISGGVPLFPEKQLCHYESLSDNTVYLVCKSGVPEIMKPATAFHSYADQDLAGLVEASFRLPVAVETVKSRMLLAQRICEVDESELREIKQLVFDQHLQQQGWAAVVANLDDLVSGFEKRACAFQRQLGDYMKKREDILALLRRMPEILILLGKIPVLPCLETVASRISVSLRGLMDQQPSFTAGNLTLYQWMNAQDPKYKLEDVIHDVTSGTNQLGEQLEEKVSQDIQGLMKFAAGRWPTEMKSIRGLEERLYSLDKLTSNAKTTVDEQISTREGFRLNWSRLETEKDASILPDLCTSHKNMMQELLNRHQRLLELKKKCTDAKKELSDNLQRRLNWVMSTHQSINEMDNRLFIHYNLLSRVHVRVDFLRQVERAPQVYAWMVVEVVRRRLFSQHYMKWATGVADESKKEHKKEMNLRKSFTKRCGSHFLQKLFLGFKDHVPKFATEAPKNIDDQLPEISPTDIAHLAQCVPELQQQLRVPTGTGSPALASSFQQPLALDGGADPFMIEASQSMVSCTASSVTQSSTSFSHALSGSVDLGPELPLQERGEREKLSLSYQGGEQRVESKLAGENKDQLFLSLQDKFPEPQCLSASLTAEVNSAAMSTISVSVVSASPKAQELSSALEELGQQQPQHQEGGGDGVLLSSGDIEPTKSSDSDVISHESLSEHKPRSKRRCIKGLSDTSPDGDTSQEFTTADFYIEDSMPSSITDSPPKPSGAGKDVGEIDAALAEKTKRVGELEGELSALQSKLAGSEEKLASLQCVLNSDISFLRDSLTALRQCVQECECQRNQIASEAQEVMVRLCAKVVENVESEKQEVLKREREGSRQTMEELEAKLQAKCQSMEELQQGMLKVSHCIADLNKELHQQRESSQKEIDSLKEKHAEEVKELQRKNLLEVELETDRIRTEMQESLDRQDGEIHHLQQELEQCQKDLVQAKMEKDMLSETLLHECAEEKRKLQESLEAEKNHAMEQIRTAIAAETKKETENMLRKEIEHKETETLKQIEELNKFFTDKEVALMTKHEAELDSVNREWADKLATQEADLQAEFDLKLERTKIELQDAVHSPEVFEIGVQSYEFLSVDQGTQNEVPSANQETQSELSLVSQATQSDASHVLVSEQGIQSEKCAVGELGVQCGGLGSVKNRVAQTEERPTREQGMQHDSQREERCFRDHGVQSDRCAVTELGIQCEQSPSRELGVQSETGEVMSVEQHQQLLQTAGSEEIVRLNQRCELLLDEERQKWENRLAQMEKQHKIDKEETMQEYRSTVLAESQISFNEAIKRAIKERDLIIEDLRRQLSLRSTCVVPREYDSEVDRRDIQKQLADIKEKESLLKREKHQLEDEVSLLKHRLHQYSEQLQSMSASAMPVSVGMTQSSSEEAMTQSTAVDQDALSKLKDQRISELERKLMETSMTTSVRKEARDRVSILTCNVGDLVLLCLDERHDQYVVFTVGTTLHFLHSDCIDALGLRSAEGEPRKNWVLAEVTDREYCQARKAQNRFKVPVNTKFYRVKAKPWMPKSPGGS